MLAGKVPYGEVSKANIAQAIAVGPPTPILKLNPKASEHLARIAEWAMPRAWKDRYAGMGDVIGDLKRLRDGREPLGPHGGSVAWARMQSLRRVLRRRRRLAVVVTVALLCGAVYVWSQIPKKLTVVDSWQPSHITSWGQIVQVKWQRKPVPTSLVLQDEQVFPVSAQGRLMPKMPVGDPGAIPLWPPLAADVDRDGIDEIFMPWTKGREVGISSIRKEVWTEVRFTALGAEPHPKDPKLLSNSSSALMPKRFLPAEIGSNGRTNRPAKLLAYLHTNRSKRPRALCCYDYATQKEDWRTEVGPPLTNLEMLDLDGDGAEEILCGSAAPCNGNAVEGAGDDSHSYIFTFHPTGGIFWKAEIPGDLDNASVVVRDLDGNGHPEILAFRQASEVNHATNAPNLGRVMQLNPTNGAPGLFYAPRVCLLTLLAHDLEGDGQTEILCTDCRGDLHVLNADLSLRKVVPISPRMAKTVGSIDHVTFRLNGLARLRRGQRPYLVTTSWENHDLEFRWGKVTDSADKSERRKEWIFILDSSLKVVARHHVADRSPAQFSWNVLITDLEADGEDEILLLSERVDVLKLKP